MKRIEQNHWYIQDNKMSIGLTHNHVSIDIKTDGEFVVYTLEVIDEKRERLYFDFYSLENAMAFTEEVIALCWTNKEVKERYEKLCEKKALAAKPTNRNKIVHPGNTVDLDEDEVLDAIGDFFGEGRENGVEVVKELSLDENRQPKVVFYLVEDYLQQYDKTRLTEGDLTRAFNHYLEGSRYELDSFKYVGGVREIGYGTEPYQPYFEGIELKVKPKEKTQKLALKKED